MQSAIISYTLTVAMLIPVSGWLADRFGTRRIFTLAVSLFTLGSLACALSNSLPQLVVFRVIQGIGGAMMMPVARLALPYQAVNTVEGAQQLLPMGPVASQEAIKMLGTNGGGFFNANSSHPFENPTALTNFVQMLAIFLIPTALCFAFGEVTGDRRQGRMLLWAMSVIFVICVGVVMWAEVQGNPHLLALGTDSSINMEGKESRFGVLVSSLFAVVTTAASCGAVIAMHDSFTALGGMVPMWLMQIGEVVFGGVGSGLYGMMLFVLLAVFIAGLMIGRTPEYLGKKIDVREMKLTVFCAVRGVTWCCI